MALTIKPVHRFKNKCCISLLRDERTSLVDFSFFFWCVCVLHVRICMCKDEHVYRCVCMHKPEVAVKNYLPVLLHLIHWDK